jgi:thiol-disulfide isomerase/thioredoxin
MLHRSLYFLLITLLPISVQADIHKCAVDGKIVYTDEECADNKSLAFTLTDINTTPATDVSYKGSRWLRDNNGYALATDASVTENAPIFIYGHTDWCGYCKKLDGTLLSDSDVKNVLAQFIKVDLNPEHSTKDDRLFKSFGGRGYPSLFIQYPHQAPQKIKNPFTQVNGKFAMQSKEAFIAQLQIYLKPFEQQKPEGKKTP